MAANPLPILIICLSTLIFEGMVFGEEMGEKAFGASFGNVDGECTGDGFFAGIKCLILKIEVFFRSIGTIIGFIWNLVSFNIDGAPWFIRVPVGSFLGFGLVWSSVTLFRGN